MKYPSTTVTRFSAPQSWALVGMLLAVATAVGFLLDHHISLTSQAMIYVLTVVVASYKLRWQQSVGCALGAVTALNYFFVPPRWTFEVESQEHLIALFTMLLVALVISHLAEKLRWETDIAHLNFRRASQLQELATALSSVTTPAEVASLGNSALATAFAGPCMLALCGAGDELTFASDLPSFEADGMRCCMREMATLGPGTGRWPGLDAWFTPLGNTPHFDGAVCIRPAPARDTAGREHGQALCALLGQALERLRLSQTMQTAQSEAQRQQIQSTYLAAISHDLRTPLAAVVGAASSLQTQGDKLNAAERERLLGSIVSEATYLSQVTENTLQLVHLTNASQAIQRDWESMEEVVGSVLVRMRQRDPSRRIKSSVPQGLPLIRADPVLLAQMLGNLLDNALKYSPDTVDLTVNVVQQTLQLAVKDRGAEIPEDKYQSIFEPYSRNDLSGQRGSGLGLALCRAIATAHGGSLTLRRRSGGGNSFTFSMPLESSQPQGEQP
jgi:two-component system sensor histidine kinase KdpD